MLGKLKSMASSGLMDKAIDQLCPQLRPHLDKLQSFKGSELNCDETFSNKFVVPTQIALAAASGGITKMIPGFDKRFTGAMLHARNELCVICPETDKVALASDTKDRLAGVLLEGFKQAG